MRFSCLFSGWFAVLFLIAATCTGRALARESAGRPATVSPAKNSDVAGREAVRWGLFVASLDPNGVTAPGVSDFADGSCMRAMALSYDACYDLFSEAERAQMRHAMTARGSRLFNRMAGSLEARIWNAHVWQHILLEFTELALATLGEIPEAETWLNYAYELWVNRFPLMGGDDGGWAEGIGYFGSNLDTLLAVPSLWSRLTGVDFFAGPWYRNVPYFHLYVWPPGSASDGFGDGTERGGPPSSDRGVFLRALGERSGNPYALWYAREVKGMKDGMGGNPLLAWRRLRVGPWRVQAELDRARDASLLVERTDGKAAFAADRPALLLAGKKYDIPKCGAILVEEQSSLVQSCQDGLPVDR